MSEHIEAFLRDQAHRTEALLDRCLPTIDTPPARLHAAMRHAVLGGGKRLRPALVCASCLACGGTAEDCAPAMVAIELLHGYTLVHDDLPCMDDDVLRRGKPTVHVAFDEATAVLVGDALQALAFTVLADAGAAAVACLGQAAGSTGVVGGQQDDLDAEHACDGQGDQTQREALLLRIHERKTGALFAASCQLGALAAGAEPAVQQAWSSCGLLLGGAFQAADDILDATSDAASLGKTPGKDARQDKLTTVTLLGLERARALAASRHQHTLAALAALPGDTRLLCALVNWLSSRQA